MDGNIPFVRGPILILLLSIMIIGAVVPPIHAGTLQATVTTDNRVRLDYHIEFHENITTLAPSSAYLDSSTNSTLAQAMMDNMTRSIRAFVPTAGIDPSQFRFQASVVQLDARLNIWKLDENLTAVVTGATSNTAPGLVQVNMGFLNMNDSNPVRLGNVEYNSIGPTLIIPVLVNATQFTGYTFYLDQALHRGGPYSSQVIATTATQGFNLLDFSWVPKLSAWQNTYQPLAPTTIWTFSPSRGLPYNLTFGVQSRESQALVTPKTAYYTASLALTTPARAQASGSTVSYNVPLVQDYMLLAIVIVLVAVALSSFFVERRVVRSGPNYVTTRKKKPRR